MLGRRTSRDNMISLFLFFILGQAIGESYEHLGSLTDSLLQEVLERMELENQQQTYLPPPLSKSRFRTRHDGLLVPSIRDQEYLEHSSLWGHQYMQGGAGEGGQRLKPDGSVPSVQVVKSDSVLPAYCNPPNPCPYGYTEEDGCIEDFENTALFSQEFQAAQHCMCDSEHMFDCPGSSRDSQIDALARSIQNEGLMDSTLDRLVQNIQIDGEHKNLVAKKFFTKKASNPYLTGDKLPVVAKKAPRNLIM